MHRHLMLVFSDPSFSVIKIQESSPISEGSGQSIITNFNLFTVWQFYDIYGQAPRLAKGCQKEKLAACETSRICNVHAQNPPYRSVKRHSIFLTLLIFWSC